MRRLLVLFLALTTSCAGPRGFDRGPLLQGLRPEAPVVTDEEVARVLAARPQLPQRFKVAVAFKPIRPQGRRGLVGHTDRWTGTDKDALLTRLVGLVGDGGLAGVIPVVDDLAGGEVKALRLAAARHGADAVLVVGGAGDVDRYNNGWAGLYVTLVGAFIAPGTEADALFLASATLWDVRNEYLYASAEVEAVEHDRGPLVFIDDTQLLAAARAKAVAALATELERRLRSLSGQGTKAP
jgi:hypothetical protein